MVIKLRLSDLFVLVSTGETFGMAYLESGSRANVIIATENDGIDGFVKNCENGFICQPDIEQLANLIDEVYEMPRQEIRKILLTLRKDLLLNDNKTVAKTYLDQINSIIYS